MTTLRISQCPTSYERLAERSWKELVEMEEILLLQAGRWWVLGEEWKEYKKTWMSSS